MKITHPIQRRAFEQLGRVARVILFDKRGVGVSDRQGGPATIEQTVADARCVLDAAGAAHVYIMGTSEGMRRLPP